MNDSFIKDLKKISPKQILPLIEEQIFQNEINIKFGRKKYTMCLLGSPGIGKTQIVEEYPYLHLSQINFKFFNQILYLWF